MLIKLLIALCFLAATASPAWAAFPTVIARNSNGDASNGQSSSVALAGSGSLQSGDLLLVYFACRDAGNTIDWTNSGGFTEVAEWETLDGTTSGAVAAFAYKISDGTETTITVDHPSTNDGCAWRTWQIRGHHASTVPEIATIGQASTVNPNPPSLNPSNWDAEDTLWLALSVNPGSATYSAFPTDYVQTGSQFTTGAGNVVRIGFAERELNAASEDPGTFTISAAISVAAATVAIRPAAAAAPSGCRMTTLGVC